MALFALCLWPVIALVIAARVPRPAALVWMVLIPYMFLPEAYAINLPGLPPLEKGTVIAGSLLLAFALFAPPERGYSRTPATRTPPETGRPWLRRLLWACIVTMALGAALTVRQNTDPIVLIDRTIPGTGPRDLISFSLQTLVMLTPFFLAVRYLRTAEDRQTLLRACVTAGLIYSLFMLVELRLSPQFHNWLYGFHQHSFLQHVRDGYRPKVFLDHGLQVGFFMLTSLLAALALWKEARKPHWIFAALWLGLILLLSRNLGATMIAVMVSGLMLLNIASLTRITVIGVCVILLAYPTLRVSPLSPVDPALQLASTISEDRAQSFAFRLKHEDALLEKATERPLFGWGSWGRNRIYDEYGRDLSVTDGLWILQVGSWGWVGYLSFFLILCLPLLAVAWRAGRVPISPVITGLLLITTGNLIYVIPNAVISPLSWLMFGALFGYALLQGQAPQNAGAADPAPAPRTGTAFSRFPAKARARNGLIAHSRRLD